MICVISEFNLQVAFPPCVQWLSLEFDPQCGTAQVEDTLQVHIPSRNNAGQMWLNSSQINTASGSQDFEDDQYVPYWPVFRKFSGSFDWPSTALLLPGIPYSFFFSTIVIVLEFSNQLSNFASQV